MNKYKVIYPEEILADFELVERDEDLTSYFIDEFDELLKRLADS